MDQNLEESLSLGGAIGVDFGQSEHVVHESDITLSASEEIPIEYESTEEQSMLMDTEGEEIIVSDFMGDPLSLQEYTLQAEHSSDMATISEVQHGLSSQADKMIDLQYETQANITVNKSETQPKIITVKAVTSIPAGLKKQEPAVLTTVPRQVAIAPKPPSSVKTYSMAKQMAIAPKPVSLIANRSYINMVKKVSIAGVAQGSTKGNSVLAQFGKQLIMVPSGAQKIKLVSSGTTIPLLQYINSDSSQAQLVQNKTVNVQQNKPVLTKLISLQGQTQEMDTSNQPVVITKLMSEGSKQQTFYTLQQKSVPITIGNKVLIKSPSKQTSATAKKQEIIAIHAPNAKIMPAISSGTSQVTEQKVLISSNPTKNVVLKPALAPKTAQVSKKGNVVEGQQTQLHQINVPGKGVQYIRLITNPTSVSKPVTIKPQPVLTVPSKTFVLTDNKVSVTPAPQKLVRIAPVGSKPLQTATQLRPSQSLLAPLSPVKKEAVNVESTVEQVEQMEEMEVEEEEEELHESKEALRNMIDRNSEDHNKKEYGRDLTQEIHIQPDVKELDRSDQSEYQDLIVIPSHYEELRFEEQYKDNETRNDNMMTMNVEGEVMSSYQSPTTPALSDSEMVSSELGLRPRKACNCTKSQCLKLYCDCFANGEFCNRCNCNNCHNNLENEELRQKAIRGCLDRNPNAFRPKIGKTKSGGPDIVRRHNKGCNCKRSGCLKNYCECYEAKIACTAICKCVGCRNVEDCLERTMRYESGPGSAPRRLSPRRPAPAAPHLAPHHAPHDTKQPCSFMTTEVIEAVCQCLIAVAVDREEEGRAADADPVRDVIEEFARCLQDIISTAHHAAHHAAPSPLQHEGAA